MFYGKGNVNSLEMVSAETENLTKLVESSSCFKKMHLSVTFFIVKDNRESTFLSTACVLKA